ncbi:MAG: TIGR04551 family protein [Myxococcota bacterium]
MRIAALIVLGGALLAMGGVLAPTPALGQTVVSRAPEPGGDRLLDFSAHFRTRGELLSNLDLDRGPTPSGDPIFPVPLGDPDAQTLTYADFRLRTDLDFHVPSSTASLHLRLDVLDNFEAGSLPDAAPADARGTEPIVGVSIIRAWAQVITPFGVLAAGRIGSQFGLGIVANAGDCDACNVGDAADRVVYLTPLLGHLLTLSYDFSATGPSVERSDRARFLDIDPSDDVRTFNVSILRLRDERARRRRRAAGKTTLEYGGVFSYRTQENDAPTEVLDAADGGPLRSTQLIARGYEAFATSLWFRVAGPWGRIEAEGAFVRASFDEASLIPGVLLRDEITSTQRGAALEAEIDLFEDWLQVGFDAGVASGDEAPGFGANVPIGAGVGQPGDLEGAQIDPPFDTSLDNFRFHPSYFVDQILFREIIGRVTDAVYIKPRVQLILPLHDRGRLELSLAVNASWALEASSTPGGASALGVEVDPSISYENSEGWAIQIDYGVLFPMAGFDNPTLGLGATTAQVLRARGILRL